jgi:hypothetical protein
MRAGRMTERVEAIAQELHCTPQMVRRRLHRFDALGIEGLFDRPKAGRPRHQITASIVDSCVIVFNERSTRVCHSVSLCRISPEAPRGCCRGLGIGRWAAMSILLATVHSP